MLLWHELCHQILDAVTDLSCSFLRLHFLSWDIACFRMEYFLKSRSPTNFMICSIWFSRNRFFSSYVSELNSLVFKTSRCLTLLFSLTLLRISSDNWMRWSLNLALTNSSSIDLIKLICLLNLVELKLPLFVFCDLELLYFSLTTLYWFVASLIYFALKLD